MDEPITIAEAAIFLRLDDDSPIPEQDLIEGMIKAARIAAEKFLNRSIVSEEKTLSLDAFSPIIDLPDGDVSSVDQVAYIDTDGNSQTVGDYILSENRLTPAYGEKWPSTRAQLGAVTITYTAGYLPTGSPPEDSTPEPIKQAIYLMIGDYYENREAGSQGNEYRINPTAESLLFPYRLDLGV